MRLRLLALCLALPACGSVVDLPSGEAASDGTTDASPAGTTDASPVGTSDGPVPSTSATSEATESSSGGIVASSGGETGQATTGVDTCGPGSFLCDPMDTEGPLECSLWEQDCPDGEKCNPWANDGGSTWNALRCVPIDADPDGPGQACTVEGSGVSGLDSCELGSICWDVDARTNTGTCVPHCVGSPRAPLCDDPNRICSIGGDSLVGLCIAECDPLEADCPAGDGCYPWSDTFVCVADASGGGGGTFEPCEFLNACDSGLLCGDADVIGACMDASSCCTPFCDLTAPNCPDPTTCVPYFSEGNAPPESVDVGVCVAQ